MIADLHCHFPMHLVKWEEEHVHPRDRVKDWWDHVRHEVNAEGFDLAAKMVNNIAFGDGWRVGLEGPERGGAAARSCGSARQRSHRRSGLRTRRRPSSGA